MVKRSERVSERQERRLPKDTRAPSVQGLRLEEYHLQSGNAGNVKPNLPQAHMNSSNK